MTIEEAVTERYAEAAQTTEPGLCCPVEYDARFLDVIPADVLERDYGCGDPVRHVRPGETVVDLGCGVGKVCFIAAQVVGASGRVIGVDSNPAMLQVARANAPTVAGRIGYDVTEFVRGRIEDLALDLDAADALVAQHSLTGADDFRVLAGELDELRRRRPLVDDDVADIVVSNCVLNLVEPLMKPAMFADIHRVLKPGGRAVISDIVASSTVPQHLRDDPDLWSGCYSGALCEAEFLDSFRAAGFEGTTILDRKAQWTEIEEIGFRSVTVEAWKPHVPSTLTSVLYGGPFASVEDDSGVVLHRGATTTIPTGVATRLVGAGCGVQPSSDAPPSAALDAAPTPTARSAASSCC
ncbi:MAG: methyltransferase domain-containing protein [Ilumatobacter sp.]|nr:methyltransferase domain-containing protein [Ilumatobacter sp.]